MTRRQPCARVRRVIDEPPRMGGRHGETEQPGGQTAALVPNRSLT
jgi:hypothetical protein